MTNFVLLEDDKKKEISHVYHISNIDIKINERYNEYNEVFDNLINVLNQNTKKNAILVITGNILQDCNLVDICALKLLHKIMNINSIMPIIIIMGFHDYDMKCKERNNFLDELLKRPNNPNPIY